MFDLTRQELGQTLCNYEKILDRVREVVDEIGFLTAEYDTLEIELERQQAQKEKELKQLQRLKEKYE